MKPCRQYREDLAMLAINALEAERACEVRAHVACCAGCRGYLQDVSHVSGVLGGVRLPEEVRPSRSFHHRVVAGVQAEGRGRVIPKRMLQWGVAVVGVGILAVMISLFPNSNRRESGVDNRTVVALRSNNGDSKPTIANYLMAVDRSTEALDNLLSQQMKAARAEPRIYTAMAVRSGDIAE